MKPSEIFEGENSSLRKAYDRAVEPINNSGLRCDTCNTKRLSVRKMTFEFSPKDFVLCKSDDEMLGDYTLNYLIDRSEKGKDPDIGMPKIYISEYEAEKCRKMGFLELNSI
jgi:hypothetical protein